MVNLLPQKTQRKLIKRYYLHLGTSLFLALSLVLFVGGVLLIPSYFSAKASADSYERYRDAFEGAVGLKEREYVKDDILELRERVNIMEEYVGNDFSAGMIDALGEKLITGISVTGISFKRTDSGATLSVSGSARTRENLLSFVDGLKKSPAFAQVTLPVSQLVIEEDPSFSLQMIYTKQ